MPRKLMDDEGNEIEVPTEEELKELKASAEKAGELGKLNKLIGSVRQALEIKEDEDIVKAVQAAQEAANPNWKGARTKIKNLTDYALSTNKNAKIDEDGKVVVPTKSLSKEDIEKTTQEATIKTLNQRKIDGRLSKYPENKRPAMKKQFEKQSAGEELNEESIDRFFDESEKIVIPGGAPGTHPTEGGDPVLERESGEDFAATEKGKEAGSAMGLRSFDENNKTKENK